MKFYLICLALLALAVADASAEVSAAPLRWRDNVLEQSATWYGSAAGRAMADSVLAYQSPQGGWPKNTDLAKMPRSAADVPQPGEGPANTIDNNGTTRPMLFLALVMQATGEAKYKEAFLRGLDYLFAAQYTNGGWPQFYPLRHGYYSHITYNDGAMVNVLNLLRDVAGGKTPYGFVDQARRAKAAAAVAKGTECILRTQVRVNGKLTVWCAQHDEVTLAPAWARNYEIPSLSGDESVGIVRFLMGIENPSPEVVTAIEGAVAWFKASAINGMRYGRGVAADGKRDGWIKPDPTAGPLWARFYEIGSNRPIFTGRDKEIHYTYDVVERERRGGYDYYGTWAANLLEREYPDWRKKHHQPGAVKNQSAKL